MTILEVFSYIKYSHWKSKWAHIKFKGPLRGITNFFMLEVNE